MECASCAAKPGSPQLCEACLHNRALVGRLKTYMGPCDLAFRKLYPPDQAHLFKAFAAGWDAAVAHAFYLHRDIEDA